MRQETLKEDIYYAGHAPAWAGVGQALNNPKTSEEAIKQAGLDWKVRLVPIEVDGKKQPDYLAIQRNLDKKVYGVVKPGWKAIQNVDAFKFFDPIVAEGLAQYHMATELQDGEKVCILTRLTGDRLNVTKHDSIDKFLLLSTGHNGKMGVKIQIIPVRSNSNTILSVVEDKETDNLRIIHSPKALKTLQQLHDVIENAERIFARTVITYQNLLKIEMDEVEKYIADILYAHRAKDASDADSRTVSKIASIFYEHPMNNHPSVKGTLWAAYNSIAFYIDHVRGHDETRLHQSLFGTGKILKQKAFDSALEIASQEGYDENERLAS